MFFDLQQLRSLSESLDLDAIVATSEENFHLLTGFQSNVMGLRGGGGRATCFVVIPTDESIEPALVASDGDECPQLRGSWIKDQRIFASGMYIENGSERERLYADPLKALTDVLSERRLDNGRLGVEMGSLSVTSYGDLKKFFPEAELVDCTEILKRIRSIKTKEAIDLVIEATRITDRATEAFLESVKAGIGDRELKEIFVQTVSKEGGDIYHPAHLVVHTRYGPVLHRVSQLINFRLREGDIVRIDAGAAYEGWTSDICRVAAVGRMPERCRKIYEVLCAAQEKVIDNIKPGAETSELFRIGESLVKEKYPAYVRYMLGHSIGLEIHEEPLIAPSPRHQLKPGMVLAIELPFYSQAFGGLNIEDVVLVTEDGHRVLSACPRNV